MKMYWSYKSFPELSGLSAVEAKTLYEKVSKDAQGSYEEKKGTAVMLACGGMGGAFGHAVDGALLAAGGAIVGGMIGGLYFLQVLNSKMRALLRERGYPLAQPSAQVDRP